MNSHQIRHRVRKNNPLRQTDENRLHGEFERGAVRHPSDAGWPRVALLLAVLTVGLLPAWAYAQPTLASVSPVRHDTDALRGSNITAAFDTDMSAATASTYVVHGALSGRRLQGAHFVSGGFLVFDPASDFYPSEDVEVTLTTGVINASGAALETPHVWRFRTAAGTGPAILDVRSSNFGTGGDSTYSVAVADVNGNGFLDIAAGNGGGQNIVYLNDGNGNYTSGTRPFGTGSDETRAIAFGDVDGDGDLDLAVGNLGEQNAVYLNDGNGNFTAGERAFGPGSDSTYSIALGDVDGDGDLDLATGNDSTPQNAVFLNDGNGNFTDSQGFGPGNDRTMAVAFGDVDSDGDLDLAVGNRGISGGQNVVYLNDGAGTFSSANARNLGTGTDITRSIALADADGDGDLDIAVGNEAQQNVVYLNDGSGGFSTDVRNIGSGTDSTYTLAFGDLDGDGDLDVAVGNRDSQNSAYLNDGAGNFTAGTRDFNGVGETQSIAFADTDNDSDLDVVVGLNGQQNRISFNHPAPKVTEVSPGQNDTSASTGSDISATFDKPLIPAGSSTFVAHGAFSGKLAGAYGGGGSKTLTLNPLQDFKPGEEIEVSLTGGLLDNDDGTSPHPFVWRFRAAAGAGSGLFNAGSAFFGTGSDASYSLAFGDVNQDGYMDLAVGNDGMQNVVYINDGNGSLAGVTRTFGPGNDSTASVAFGDVDGDGDLDVFAGNAGQKNVIYLNDGSGDFSAGTRDFGTGSDWTNSIALGDVDGDGDLDIAVGNWNSQQNVVYLNDGSGHFDDSASARTFGAGTDSTTSTALGDVDGDGDLDIAVGNSAAQPNAVYLNDGSGNFTAGTRAFGTGSDESLTIAMGDVDGDGDLDIAVGNSGEQSAVYRNDGNGDFSGSSEFGTPDVIRTVAFGDVDGDGDLDLAVGNATQDKVILNDGNGNFTVERGFSSSSGGTATIAFGDVDGDGDLDAAAANSSGQNIVFFNVDRPIVTSVSPAENAIAADRVVDITAGFDTAMSAASGATFAAHGAFSGRLSGTHSGGGTSILSFDPTRDLGPGEEVEVTLTSGLQDQTSGASSSPYVWRFRAAAGAGPAIFEVRSVDFDGGFSSAVCLGDVNGDGNLDIAVGSNPQQNVVYLNDGNRGFSETRNFGTGTDATTALAFGDVDGDGDIDLAVGNASERNSVYLNDGSGSFVDSRDFGTGTDAVTSLAFGDVDGDGDLDLAVGNALEQDIVYLNDGSGLFSTARNFGTGTDHTRALVFADVDVDGDLDLAVGNAAEPNAVYLNDGVGNFLSSRGFGTGSDSTYAVAVGDVDADGDADIATGDESGQNVVYLNDGSGNFTAGTSNFGTGIDHTRGIALGDVDGDGDLDLAVANSDGQQDAVYLNDGVGSFAATALNFGTGSDNSASIALGTMDGDTDLDIVVANWNEQNLVVFNTAATEVASVFPAQNAAGVDRVADVSVTFKKTMNVGDGTTFVAHGGFTGKLPATYGGGGTDVLTLDSASDFKPGEEVEVSLTSGLQDDNDGDSLRPFVWRFFAAAAAGPSVFDTAGISFGAGVDDVRSIAFGDVNGDGKLDVAVGNWLQQSVVYLNDNLGSFAAGSRSFGSGGDQTTCVALADVDGDGDLDLAAANLGEQNFVYLNDGSGDYAGVAKSFGTGQDSTRAIAFADVDGDGDLDLAVGNESQQNVVYLNDGAGNFTAGARAFGTAVDVTYDVKFGDIDNDGDMDVAAGNFTESNTAYLNDGRGNFSAGSRDFGTGADLTRTIALADVNGDGYLDVAVGNSSGLTGQPNDLYLNDGNGNFTGGRRFFGTGSDKTESIAFADVDADGDLDLAAGNDLEGNLVYLNDGSGNFAGETRNFGTGTENTRAIALGDVDGDGDLDMVVGGSGHALRSALNASSPVVDEPPSIGVTPSTAAIQFGETVEFSVTATDAEAQLIAFSDEFHNGAFSNFVQLAGDASARYTYTGQQAGVVKIVLTAMANGLTDTVEITITVAPPLGPSPGVVVGTGAGAAAAGFKIFTSTGSNFDGQPNLSRVSSATASVPVVAADLIGDGTDEIVTGSGPRVGLSPNKNGAVTVFNSATRDPIGAGLIPFPVDPDGTIPDFDNNPTGEVRIAAGQLIGASPEEIIIVQGANAQSRYRIVQLADGQISNPDLNTFRPLELGNPAGGINTVAADIDGDGFDEIICAQVGAVTTVAEGGPFDFAAHIQAINILDPEAIVGTVVPSTSIQRSRIQATFGLASNPSGAVRLAAGDIDGDGSEEIIIVSSSMGNVAGGNRILILKSSLTNGTFTSGTPFEFETGADGQAISFQLFDSVVNPSGNIYLDTADLDGDGADEIMVGLGEGAANEVRVYEFNPTASGAATLQMTSIWNTFSSNSEGATHVAGGMFGVQ